MPETVGLIAGGGQFPFLVAQGVKSAGDRVVAVGFPRNTDPAFSSVVDSFLEVKLGQLVRVIEFFKAEGVSRVVMAGTINKARAMDLRPDWRAARLLFRLKGKGDDALLRAIAEEFDTVGLPVCRAHEVVPQLLTPKGILTAKPLTEDQKEDIRVGWPIAKTIGELDIGQTIVLKRQVVAAVEGLEGTDATIRRGGELAGEGCSIIKVFKPGQEERVDLPSIGLETIKVLREIKAGCLVVEAGKSLFFDAAESLELANRNGITIVGVDEQLLNELTR